MPVGRFLASAAVAQAVQRHDRGPGRVQRLDRIQWRVDAATKIVHPNGMVDVRGVATRTGVLLYEDETGAGLPPARELRPPSEVFNAQSLATLVGAPMTIEHPGQGPDPDGGAGEVTAANVRQLGHGWVLSVEPDEASGLVWVWVRLASEDILAAVSGGKVELSCGYTAVLVDPRDPAANDLWPLWGPEPGVSANGEAYDLAHTQVIYNHLALVDQARAGHVARLLLDSKAARMKTTIKIDGKTHEINAFMAKAIRADALDPAKAKADALEVGPVSIDGVDLILPRSTIDQILAMLGGSGGPSAPPPAMDAAPPVPPPIDPTKPPMMDAAQEPKMDAKTIQAWIADGIRAHLPQVQRQVADSVTTQARERAAVERAALPVLGQRFDYQAHDEHGIALAVLEADKSPRLDNAKALAERARKGDAAAGGRLAQLMEDALDRRRDALDTSGALGGALFQVAAQHQDSASDDETPERKRVAQEKRDAADKRHAAA